MLSFLRSKKNSLPVKIVFGVIAFLLVAFFGAKTGNNFSIASTEAMTINGEIITFKRLDYELEQQLQAMKTQYNMTEIPENLTGLIRGNVAERILQQILISQNVKALGVTATDSELSTSIKNEFTDQGGFNADAYLNNFLPYYLASTGLSFEDEFRKQLAVSKVGETLTNLFQISDDEAKELYKSQNTKYRFSVIKVSKFNDTKDKDAPEELQSAESDSKQPNPNAPVLAATIFDKWTKGEKIDDLLKDNKLSQRVTNNLTLAQIDRVLDGDATFEEMLMLAKLNEKTLFPSKIIEKENAYYLVKFDAKTASPTPDEKALEELKAAEQNQMISELESAWITSLKASAKIKKSPKL